MWKNKMKGCGKLLAINEYWELNCEEKNHIICGTSPYGVNWFCPECVEMYKNVKNI